MPGWRASWRATRRREPRALAPDQPSSSTRLERDAGAREAFLREATAGDPDLLREVQTLLASHATRRPVPRRAGLGRRRRSDPRRRALNRSPASTIGHLPGARGDRPRRHGRRLRRRGRAAAAARWRSRRCTPEYTRDPLRRERLTREARAAAALSHPAIATIFALEEIDGELYIVSELVRGRTLREELRDGPLPAGPALPALLDDRRGARRRARTRHRPSRSEAGEHHPAHGRPDQGSGLRPRAQRRSVAMRPPPRG